jgi:adenine-specific DNA-methyltransferase
MDYIGSKEKLNPWIFDIIRKVVPLPPEECTFLDACSGSGSTSRYAARLGYKVISNDNLRFARAIANGSIGLTPGQKQVADDWLEYLNTLEGRKGFFFRNFCEMSTPPRLYFTPENARIIDHVRRAIDPVYDPKVKDYLLYCGIEALSRVSNTAGVQAAFLKSLKQRARARFTLRSEDTVNGSVEACSRNILDFLTNPNFRSSHEETILYIDPPYNNRQYGPNYHLYETFVRNDSPTLTGKTGLRADWQNESKSLFCSKKGCLEFLCKVIAASTAKYVFVSYSSDGLITPVEVRTAYPNMNVYTFQQRRYKSDSSGTRNYNDKELHEYLFMIPNIRTVNAPK